MKRNANQGSKEPLVKKTKTPVPTEEGQEQKKKNNAQQGFMIYNSYEVPETCCTEVLLLEKKNPHVRDKHIAFEDASHKYYIKGSTERYVSVSGLAHDYFQRFDAPVVASRMIARHDFTHNEKYSKYQQYLGDATREETVQMICKSWEENAHIAATLGTDLHRFIELGYNDMPTENKEKHPERMYVLEFKQKMEKLGYTPYRTEFKLWDEDHKVAGMIDMLFYHEETGKFEIFDWKRSKEIKMSGFRKGTGPCAQLQDCNYIHYTLQLNSYRWLLEKNYGIMVDKMVIVVFHPSNDSYVEFELADMQDIIEDILAIRKKMLSEPQPDMT